MPSKNMELFGKQYTLAFKNEHTNSALYEYTTDNESVENWTHLVSLTYIKHLSFPRSSLGMQTDTILSHSGERERGKLASIKTCSEHLRKMFENCPLLICHHYR